MEQSLNLELELMADRIGVNPEILTHGVLEPEALLIGRVIMMMNLPERPRELDMLRELAPPTKS